MDHEKFDQWDEDRRRRREEREARRADRSGRREARGDRGGERPRKERVLHTRISDQLDDTLRRAADDLRLPVSNLVRNVLEDVFTVVESVTENVEELVEDIVDEAQDVGKRLRRRGKQWDRERDVTPRRRENDPARRAARREMDELLDEEPEAAPVERERQEFPDVVGWQPLVLNQPQQCADCGRDLIRGDRASLGTMLTPPADGVVPYLCSECVRARS